VRRLALVVLLLALPATASAQSHGRQLFLEGCASCHGFDARGIAEVGPDLHGAGASAADFYLRTGRMPLDVETGEQPLRSQPEYSARPGRIITFTIAFSPSASRILCR